MARLLSIDDWIEKLVAIPARDFTLERVQTFMAAHAVRPATLERYLFFSKGHYTRNLIFKNDLFEVMTICWDIGQASRIHNHRDQNCWMATPIGRLRVQNFRVEDRDPSEGTCQLVPTDVFEMDAEHPSAVNPFAPVHQVLNPTEFGERAVSIHVYSRPFESCEVYSREKGTYSDVPLHYTSEYGQLNPEEKLL
ncbi:MAG: cysteine dioxygenase family protein [Acidobacteria bacterium]|nr:cysteine dioxygenase family protein [Acidobacteriota bacterium]